jgi:hypothetical protein
VVHNKWGAEFINSAIQVTPLPFNLDIGFAHHPTATNSALIFPIEFSFQFWRILNNPAINRLAINIRATLSHQLFNIAIT